jgi:hypothetical protein
MYEHCALIVMPMHRMNFVLDLKVVVCNKINYQYQSVISKMLKAIFELLILPPSNKVVSYKVVILASKSK